MINTIQQILQNLKPSHSAWRGAAFGVVMATLLIILASAIDLIYSNVSYTDAAFYFALGSLLISVIGAILVFIWMAISKLPSLYKWAVACFGFVIYFFFIPPQAPFGIFIIALWTLLSCSLAGGALYALLKDPNPSFSSFIKKVFCLLLGIGGLLLLAYWIITSTHIYQPVPVSLQNQSNTETLNLPDPSVKGPFDYTNLSYGSGTDLHRLKFGKEATLITPTVDGSAFISGWDSLEGWLRTRYWGFGPATLPLNGRVIYPTGEGPFPLIMIVHGNHEMSASSDKGYVYLMELLASHGFITVSVDENFLNDTWLNAFTNLDASPARGWMLLEHLTLWREWNSTKGNPFYQKVDMDHIGLVGHSRGGEAIVIAKSFNELERFPADGSIEFDYHFKIKALAAIAPVDGQYLPAGNHLKIKDVDYLVLQGSNDGDVRSFEGAAQYHRINLAGSPYHFKSSLYIYGANHGQFNTIWGSRDTTSPSSALYELASIIPAHDQQKIAEVYLTAFFKASLKNDVGYLPLFQDYRSAKAWLPNTTYFNQFADSTFQYVDKERGSLDLTKLSIAGGTSMGENLSLWKESQVTLKNGTSVGTGTFIGWQPLGEVIPSYRLTWPENRLKLTDENYLVLTLAGANNFNVENAHEGPMIDFTIQLTDGADHQSQRNLSDNAFLMEPMIPRIMKAPFLDPLYASEYVFQTFMFPLKDFVKANPDFDVKTIKELRFVFDRTLAGLIILDHVAFGKPHL